MITNPTVSTLAPLPEYPRADTLMKRAVGAGGGVGVIGLQEHDARPPVRACDLRRVRARRKGVTTAESSEAAGSGKAPTCAKTAESAAEPPQLSLDATVASVAVGQDQLRVREERP